MSEKLLSVDHKRSLFSASTLNFYKPEIYAVIAFSIMFAGLALYPRTSEYFFDEQNLINIARQVSLNAIIACGMTFAILTGGIDLSVGSIVAISGMIMAGVIKLGSFTDIALPLPMGTENLDILVRVVAGIFLGLLCGTLLGLFNGSIVAYTRIPPFITTLATMSIARGWALLYSNGYPISGLPDMFTFIGRGHIRGLPVPIYLMIFAIVVSWILLNKTRFGRYVYALGGSVETVRLSGINVKSVYLRIYTLVGGFAALSGMLLCSRLSSGQPMAGSGWELDAIAAVVVGGGNISGGRATIVGTVIGAFIIGLLNNGLNLMNVSPYLQNVVKGFVILAAVLVRSGLNRDK